MCRCIENGFRYIDNGFRDIGIGMIYLHIWIGI